MAVYRLVVRVKKPDGDVVEVAYHSDRVPDKGERLSLPGGGVGEIVEVVSKERIIS